MVAVPGGVPCEISAHISRWVNAAAHNITTLRSASLVVVCAGKNLCKTTPSLIGREVNTHLVEVIKKLVPDAGTERLPVLLVEPFTKEYFSLCGSGTRDQTSLSGPPPSRPSVRECASGVGGATDDRESCDYKRGSNNGKNGDAAEAKGVSSTVAPSKRSSERLTVGASVIRQTHSELDLYARQSGFTFCSLSDPILLKEGDFRDNLHLYDAGYRKIAQSLLKTNFGDESSPTLRGATSPLRDQEPSSEACRDTFTAASTSCVSHVPSSPGQQPVEQPQAAQGTAEATNVQADESLVAAKGSPTMDAAQARRVEMTAGLVVGPASSSSDVEKAAQEEPKTADKSGCETQAQAPVQMVPGESDAVPTPVGAGEAEDGVTVTVTAPASASAHGGDHEGTEARDLTHTHTHASQSAAQDTRSRHARSEGTAVLAAGAATSRSSSPRNGNDILRSTHDD